MNKRTKFLLLFLLTETILYFGFLWIDCSGSRTDLSTPLKFCSIVLCFLFVATKKVRGKKHFGSVIDWNMDQNIMTAALFITVLADICLLLSNYFVLGLVFFILVQLLYLYRMAKFYEIWKHSIRIVLFFILLFILLCEKIPIDFMLSLAIFYFINILCNVILAIQYAKAEYKKSSKSVLFAIGMILFFLCDVNVGIYNMSEYLVIKGSLVSALYDFSALGMWLFYLPGQVFIALSSPE